jgi:hypothetical protein
MGVAPAARNRNPMVIIAVNDVIWYSEAGVAPNNDGPFRSQDGKIPDVEHSFGRRPSCRNREFDKRRQHRDLACSGVNRIGLVKLN